MKYNTRQKTGFTLVELLVVISIIALLVSILMPALGKAREQAKKVVCQTNLKQQTLACTMYMHEYNDFFPTTYVYPGSPDSLNVAYAWSTWGGKLGTQTGSQRLLNSYVGTNQDVTLKSGDAGLGVFNCPSDRGAEAGEWTIYDTKPSNWDVYGSSYSWNGDAFNNSLLGLWKKKLSSVKRPYKTVLVGDGPIGTWSHGYEPFMNYYWHDKKELGWSNAAFVDMHIEYLQFTKDDPDFQNGPGWTFIYNQ